MSVTFSAPRRSPGPHFPRFPENYFGRPTEAYRHLTARMTLESVYIKRIGRIRPALLCTDVTAAVTVAAASADSPNEASATFHNIVDRTAVRHLRFEIIGGDFSPRRKLSVRMYCIRLGHLEFAFMAQCGRNWKSELPLPVVAMQDI